MLAPFATLAFLIILWTAAVVAAQIVVNSKLRILSVLRGEEPIRPEMSLVIRSGPSRERSPHRHPMRARPQLRAAA